MELAELTELPLAQRLHAMEVLWQSLTSTANALPEPEWHRAEVAQRMQRLRTGQEPVLAWSDAQQLLRQRIEAKHAAAASAR